MNKSNIYYLSNIIIYSKYKQLRNYYEYIRNSIYHILTIKVQYFVTCNVN